MSYCTLYIDSNLTIEEVKEIVNLEIKSILHGCDEKSTLNAYIFDNESFDRTSKIGEKLDPSTAKYYVEVYDDEPDSFHDKKDFKENVIKLVVNIRNNLEYVVVSCNFEDYIMENSGWNWSEEQPFPPK